MKRAGLAHDRVFDGDFAAEYARKHRSIAERFGQEIGGKLATRGFHGGRIIDLGCGFGATAIVLAQRFPKSEVVGVDLSGPLLALAEERAADAGLADRVRFQNANVQHVDYEEDSFDALVNVQMLHIVEEPVAMLNEMERLLIPGGALFMADIRRSWVGLLDKTFRSGLTVAEAQALVERSMLRPGSFSSALLWWRFEA